MLEQHGLTVPVGDHQTALARAIDDAGREHQTRRGRRDLTHRRPPNASVPDSRRSQRRPVRGIGVLAGVPAGKRPDTCPSGAVVDPACLAAELTKHPDHPLLRQSTTALCGVLLRVLAAMCQQASTPIPVHQGPWWTPRALRLSLRSIPITPSSSRTVLSDPARLSRPSNAGTTQSARGRPVMGGVSSWCWQEDPACACSGSHHSARGVSLELRRRGVTVSMSGPCPLSNCRISIESGGLSKLPPVSATPCCMHCGSLSVEVSL